MRSGVIAVGIDPPPTLARRTETAVPCSTRITETISPQSGAGVAADGSVHLNRAGFGGRLQIGTGDSGQTSRCLKHVARPCADSHEVGRGEARDGVTDVFNARFHDAERHVRRKERAAAVLVSIGNETGIGRIVGRRVRGRRRDAH